MNAIRAFVLGIRDGWNQPYEVSMSFNVDHLGDVQEWLDRGINVGQLLRAGRKSETYQDRLWPFRGAL